MHRALAGRLLALCQANGGVYIKGAQLLTSIPAVRAEYRRQDCRPDHHQTTAQHTSLALVPGNVCPAAVPWSSDVALDRSTNMLKRQHNGLSPP